MLGETAGIGGYFRGEVWKPSAVHSIKVTLMKTPSNGGSRVSSSRLLQPRKAASVGTQLPSIEVLAKGIPQKSPSNPA